MMETNKNMLITGGCGFIGSHAVKYFDDKGYNVVILDKLTYAAQPELLNDVKHYELVVGDICDADLVYDILEQHKIDIIINFAAESHVDNSISGPMVFQQTNYIGTAVLLEEARKYWTKYNKIKQSKFIQISTDEVFGSLPLDIPTEKFDEESKYSPRSPYSASKAAAEMLVMAYHTTYGMNTIITNCSNNYGPHQHTEKLIPKVIQACKHKSAIPIYGTGENVRDWLYVEDHIDAIDFILGCDWYVSKEEFNMRFCIGGNNELSNNDIVNIICNEYDKIVGNKPGTSNKLIIYVEDRLGHDKRYAIAPKKLELAGWRPSTKFNEGIEKTIQWYLNKSL